MNRMPLMLLACGLAGAQNPQPLQDFQNRVSEYQKLHDKARSGLSKLKPTSSPDGIGKHERELGHRIRESREHVAQGNIFTPEITAEFKRLIAETMKGSDAVTIKQSLARSEPVHLPELKVNQHYPKGVPLQTTPPSLLLNLPKLPKGYEYRVVSNSLVLLDVEANLIIDLMPNAIP
jgi:hypothetical protein